MHAKDSRGLAIKMYMHLRSYRKLAQLTGISKSTLHRWVTTSPVMQRNVKARKATAEVLQAIKNLLDHSPGMSAKQVRQELHGCIADKAIRCCIRKLGYTRKRLTRVVCKQGLEEQSAAIRLTQQRLPQDRTISIDESAFYFDMKPHYGYSPRGTRARAAKHSHYQSKWTLLMAVSNERVVGYKLFKGSCNADLFKELIQSLDVQQERFLLMDNVAFHKTEAVQQCIASRGLQAVFLPPYSPQFQPIEHVFSVVKAAYRGAPVQQHSTEEDALQRDMDMYARCTYAVECVEASGLQNTFAHCWAA